MRVDRGRGWQNDPTDSPATPVQDGPADVLKELAVVTGTIENTHRCLISILEVAAVARESESEMVLPDSRWLRHLSERRIDFLGRQAPRLSHGCGQGGRPT